MKIVEINCTNYGSTGNIMLRIAEAARERGHTVYTCCPASRSNRQKQVDHQILIGSILSRNLHLLLNDVTGLNGCFSCIATWLFLRKLKRIRPDVLHLHNLHNCYINLPMLFRYIKRDRVKVVWTLHDCWAMTGQCAGFTRSGCQRWLSGCHDCERIADYPSSAVDRTALMWKLKKRWFTGVEDLTLVTPSRWLAEIVSASYLNAYPALVIHNGIDRSVFKPTQSNFRQRHGIGSEEKMLLGVAHDWHFKGIDVFVRLAQEIGYPYRIVLVGVEEGMAHTLPAAIVAIRRTQSQAELAEIYSAADYFVNPTREDNFPTVNLEALACGLPVITFRTGGSAEPIDEKSGIVVDYDDYDQLKAVLLDTARLDALSREACRKRSERYSAQDRYREYVELLERIGADPQSRD